jgi:hypothetical protein
MYAKYTLILLMFFFVASEAFSQSEGKRRGKNKIYEEISFEDMVHRYLAKECSSMNSYEGIYSVSCIITQRSKKFLSKKDRVKVLERKDNYARVAILKDWPGSIRDFIEISLSFRDTNTFPVVGELSMLSEGRGMIYKHIEPDGSVMSFSLASNPTEILEGEYSFMEGRKTITYKISYLKLYPKASDALVGK